MAAAAKGIVGVCGSGLIGRGLATVFASAGYQVNLYDIKKSQIDAAMDDMKRQLTLFESLNVLRGSISAKEQLDLIKGVSTLKDCVEGAFFVQECTLENLEMKTQVFSELDQLVGPDTILASSSSAIPASAFSENLKHKANCLINHPIIPPYLIRLMEIVPAPWTSPEVISRTKELMKEVEQSPVTFTKECKGFGFNRIQLAVIHECWHLVNDGYLSVNDVDLLLTEGLGIRYAWQGPFESVHVASEGFREAVKFFKPSFVELGKTLKGLGPWDDDSFIQNAHDQISERIPMDKLQERRQWRNERFIALAKLKSDMKKKEEEGK